jgi:hypothetical protein
MRIGATISSAKPFPSDRSAMCGTFNTERPQPTHDVGMIEDNLRSFRRGEPGYDAHRSGFTTVIEHHPACVVVATDDPGTTFRINFTIPPAPTAR